MPGSSRPVITFLSDFGLDGAVGVCKGVILSICPDAQIVDIAHTLRKFAVADGSYILSTALPYMPVGTHLAVVDPGVGTERRPVAVRTARGDVLVGPDNGLLPLPAESLGGADAVRVLENRDFWLPITSSTFHGRDIFAPVAAHLAAGTASFEGVGDPLAAGDLVRHESPGARAAEGWLETSVIYVDSFGNLRLAGGAQEVAQAFPGIADGEPVRVLLLDGERPRQEAAVWATSFGAVPQGRALLYLDSSGHLALADNQASIASRLEIGGAQRLRIERA